jgi:hypothetical protein
VVLRILLYSKEAVSTYIVGAVHFGICGQYEVDNRRNSVVVGSCLPLVLRG